MGGLLTGTCALLLYGARPTTTDKIYAKYSTGMKAKASFPPPFLRTFPYNNCAVALTSNERKLTVVPSILRFNGAAA